MNWVRKRKINTVLYQLYVEYKKPKLIKSKSETRDLGVGNWGDVASVQLLSHNRLFVTPWTAVRQVSLSITNSGSLLKLMSIDLVIPSNYLILCCCPLLFPPLIFPSISVFSNESVLWIRWPKYWKFSFSKGTNLHIHKSWRSNAQQQYGIINVKVAKRSILIVPNTQIKNYVI